MNQILYSRANDGSAYGPLVVEVLSDGTYRIRASGVVYPTRRQLLIGLTHRQHWTFDRYFRLGRHASLGSDLVGSPIMDLFGFTVAPPSGVTDPLSPNLITVARQTLGIDLRRRSGEVAKLLFAGYGRRIYSLGYDPDDILQEVYKGLLIRNQGTCPWDARKSSFGHYVHMVCGCILSNYHRRESRRRAMEQVSLTGVDMDSITTLDTTIMVNKDFTDFLVDKVSAKDSRQLVLQVMPLIIEGHGRQDIAAALNISMNHVAKATKIIKATMSEWTMAGLPI